MFKYSTYQKLFLKTGLMMIAIIYSEFSFSQNCGHALNCRPVQTNTRSVVSPNVIRIGTPPSSEAIIPNQGGTTSNGQNRTAIGTSNGANDQGEDSVTLKDASGKEVRVPFGLVQVDFKAIKAMDRPEDLVASGMLSQVPVAKVASQLKGTVDISITPECQQSLLDVLDVSKKNSACSTLVNTAKGFCVNNASYSPEAQKEIVRTVIDTFNDVCFSRRTNSGAPRRVQ
ncbi:MAG: hypothetical protein KA116_12665 [Proteobacteria bacterium]|nr:hypothetical protein [Pseudomonadota bacterium]